MHKYIYLPPQANETSEKKKQQKMQKKPTVSHQLGPSHKPLYTVYFN